MFKVLIVVEAAQGDIDLRTMRCMVSALKQVIPAAASVQTIAANNLKQVDADTLLCPLTLNLPDVVFPAQSIYQACRDVFGLRQRLVEQFNISVADGCFWLPVVLTSKGPLYGEVIALSEEKQLQELSCDLSHFQPCHFSDFTRQQLYRLGYKVLRALSAPPSTYLVQFTVQDSQVCFDRLWPFPAAPAIASLGVQEPDLFTCHWRCLTGQAIIDLNLIPLNF